MISTLYNLLLALVLDPKSACAGREANREVAYDVEPVIVALEALPAVATTENVARLQKELLI